MLVGHFARPQPHERLPVLTYKLREHRSPWMEAFRGYRMTLLHDDKIVAQSGDFSSPPSTLTQLRWIQEYAHGETVIMILPVDKE